MSTKLPKNEQGVAAIIVTLIMMIVISLIVIGFSQVTRRNLRQTLDQQLSTQAYYAAETGVNDATKLITAMGTSVTSKTSCTGGSGYTSLNPALDTAGNISYSCLLVNPTPTTLLYSSVKNQTSTVVPINVNARLGSLTFSWNADGTNTNVSQCYGGVATLLALPTTNAWQCNYAILRVDLVQLNSGTTYSATGLDNQTVTFYLKPATAPSITSVGSFTGPQRAYIVASKCANGTCTSTISFTGGAQTTNYYARLSTLYRDANSVTISGSGTLGSTLQFTGAQVVVDSTGKAQDQLRRIAVRIPLTKNNDSLLPNNALETSGAICKRYVIAPGLVVDPTTGLCTL